MGKGLSERKAGVTDGGRPQEKSWRNGTQKPPSRAAGLTQAGLGQESRDKGRGRAGSFMHRLLVAVHEAAVHLSKLPIGDIAAAQLQVLQGTPQDSGQPHWPWLPASPTHPQIAQEALTVSRSRRERMLGTR